MSGNVIELPQPLPLQPEEKQLIEPAKKLSVSEWAEKYRMLSRKVSRYSGRWSNDIASFNVYIMDCLSDFETREVWDCSCAQGGKSSIAENWLGRTVDQEPGSFIVVLPDENTTKKRMRTRIRPMFAETENLRRHLFKDRISSLNIGQETELDNMFLYIGWAGSAVTMADSPVKYVSADEVAKFPTLRSEASSIDQLRDRQTTFTGESKFYGSSTPAIVDDIFDTEIENSDLHEWHVKCFYCGKYHVMSNHYMHLVKDSAGGDLDPKDYLKGGIDTCWYFCPHCEKKYDDQARWLLVVSGVWVSREAKIDNNGRIKGAKFFSPIKGFRKPAFMLYPGFMTINYLAWERAKAHKAMKAGNLEPLQKYINSRCAESWEIKEKKTELDVIKIHIGDKKPELVPYGVQMLTAGIDVQIDHIWVNLIGWGYLLEAWSIFCGRLETGDTTNLENYRIVKMFLQRLWQLEKEKEKKIQIWKSAIDCNYRPEQVINFCQECNNEGIDIIPVRGDDNVRTKLYRTIRIEGTDMYRYDLNVNALKDRFFYMLFENKVPGPGYMHLSKDTPNEYLQHFLAEEKKTIRKKRRGEYEKVWWPKAEHLANHLWDAGVYGLAAAEIAGVRMLQPIKEIKKEKKKTARRRGGFLDDLPDLMR